MDDESLERRLAAILSADAVGYSRLMNVDDESTVRTLQAHRRRIERLIGAFRGRVVDTPGDNLLAEFPSAIGAVRCALDVQRAVGEANAELDAERRMPFRIGIHLGDVLVEGERIYGDGVNVAARLEALARPGGICLSDVVYQQVCRRLELAATDLGDQELKNIEGVVRAFELGGQADEHEPVRLRASAPRKLSPPEEPSLAVLPFTNLNGDPKQDYFSDGLTMDIMAELVRIPGLFLIGQDSMFTYKSTATRPREVAGEVGVRHVLEGTVRKDEKRVRVTARLVEAASGRHIWAERYDGALEDVFAVQDEITDRVVTELDVALVHGEDARVLRQELRNPQALALIYRGTELVHRFTRDDMREARRHFSEVMRIEPECPYGYADAAWTHYFDVERGWSGSPAESLEQMSSLAHRALELQDVSGFSHLMLGHMHLMNRDHDEALALSDLSLEQRPNCQSAWGLKANILNYAAQPEEAIPLAEKSLRLSPVARPFVPEVLAAALYLSGRFDDAIDTANETLSLAPDSVNVRVILCASLAASGREPAAYQAARDIVGVDPRFSVSRFAASQPYREPAVLQRICDALVRAGLPLGTSAAQPSLAQPYSESRRRVAPRPRR